MQTSRRLSAALTGAAVAGALLGGCSSSVMDLAVGECFNQPRDDQISSVSTLDCSATHDAEVIGTVTVEQDTRPDDDAMNQYAQQQCLQAFNDYVGITYAQSELELTWLLPTASSWKNDNDRTVTCVALAPEGQTLSRSVKGLQK